MTFLTVLGQMFLKFMAATGRGRIFLFSLNGLSHCVRPIGVTPLSIPPAVSVSICPTLSTFVNIYIDGEKSVLVAS